MRAAIAFGAAALLASVAAAFALTQRASASSAPATGLRPGKLRVQLKFKPGLPGADERERDAARALSRKVFASLPGAFMGKLAVQPFSGESTIEWRDPQGETWAQSVFDAEWNHDRLGAIKEEARKAVLASLKAYEPALTDIVATRIS